MPRLVIEDGPEKGKAYDLGDADRKAVIGRSSGCDIVISDPLTSRQHFRVEVKAKKITVTDLDSHNGVHVNGERISEETVIKSGDRIRAGKSIFVVSGADGALLGGMAGRRIDDYLLQERIGVGGMGEIYKATQVSLGRTVALKILSDDLTGDKAFIEKFLSEARSAGRLNHPNVVQVHEVGQDKGTYYFSMEYVAGGSVQDILRGGGKVEPKRSVDIIIGAAKALQYAEKQGVVHCDVKPDNVMLTEDGDVRLADLGIARQIKEGRKIVQEEGVFGSPHYMAPEQAKGQPIDHRVDIYALGCTMYRMLAGKTPFTGEDARQIMEKQVYEKPSPLRDHADGLPRTIYATVEKMMRKNPQDRYPSAGDLLTDLEQCKEDLVEGKAVMPSGIHTRTAPRVKARRHAGAGGGAGILGAIIAVVLLIVVVASLSSDDGPDQGIDYLNRSQKLADAGDYDRAIELLEIAQRLTEDPQVLARITDRIDKLRDVEDQERLESAAKAALEEVDAFLRSNPTLHLEASNRYRQIAGNYKKLAISHLAEKKAKDQLGLHQARAESAFAEAKRRSDKAMDSRNYRNAWRIWEEYPKTYDETDAGAKARAEIEAVKARTEAEYVADVARGNALIGEGKFSDAIKAMDHFIYDAGLADYKARAVKDRESLRAKVDTAQTLDAAARRKARLDLADSLIEEAETMRRAYAFGGARELLRQSEGIYLDMGKKKEAEEIPPIIEDMSRQVILFESLVDATRNIELADNTVRLGDGRGGMAISATEARITLNIPGGGSIEVPWGALSAREFLSLMRSADLPAEQVLSLGLLCLRHGLGSQAEEELLRAGRMRRSLKAEAQPGVELARMIDASMAAKIRKTDADVWIARVERLIEAGDFAAAREGVIILRLRYVPAKVADKARVDALAARLPKKAADVRGGGATSGGGAASTAGGTGGAGGTAGGTSGGASRADRILTRIDSATRKVVTRRSDAALAIYRRRGENVVCGDMMLASGRAKEARAAYRRELGDGGSYWSTSGAGKLRMAKAYVVAGAADDLARAKALITAARAAATGGPLKVEADRLQKLVDGKAALDKHLSDLEERAAASKSGAAYGQLAEELAKSLPHSIRTRVAAERMRLAFSDDERVAGGRVALWALRHQWAARELDKAASAVAALRTDHPVLATSLAGELALIAAESHFNREEWAPAAEEFTKYKDIAGPEAELVADGTVRRRLKRCKIELSAAGTGDE